MTPLPWNCARNLRTPLAGRRARSWNETRRLNEQSARSRVRRLEIVEDVVEIAAVRVDAGDGRSSYRHEQRSTEMSESPETRTKAAAAVGLQVLVVAADGRIEGDYTFVGA
jgi:hypothetical protein